MRLQFNLESSALYIRDGEVEETRDLAEPGFSAPVNVDGEGNVLGLEFLSLKEYAELITRFGSTLEIPQCVEESASFRCPFLRTRKVAASRAPSVGRAWNRNSSPSQHKM